MGKTNQCWSLYSGPGKLAELAPKTFPSDHTGLYSQLLLSLRQSQALGLAGLQEREREFSGQFRDLVSKEKGNNVKCQKIPRACSPAVESTAARCGFTASAGQETLS